MGLGGPGREFAGILDHVLGHKPIGRGDLTSARLIDEGLLLLGFEIGAIAFVGFEV